MDEEEEEQEEEIDEGDIYDFYEEEEQRVPKIEEVLSEEEMESRMNYKIIETHEPEYSHMASSSEEEKFFSKLDI